MVFMSLGLSKCHWNQYFAAIGVNLLSVSNGASLGWIFACTSQFLSDKTSLDLTKFREAGWNSLDSSMYTGVLLGSIGFGWLAERIGRRRCLLWMTLPAMLSWFLTAIATSFQELCVGHFLAASIFGCCLVVIPIYITEMAEDRLRSTLGTFMALSMGIGVLLILSLEYVINYATTAWIMLLIPVAFLSTFIFIPDTPEYLERYHKEGVEESIRYFRGISSSENAQLQEELTKLSKPFQTLENGAQRDDNNLRISDFTNRKTLKAFMIGFIIVLATQPSLVMVRITYCFTLRSAFNYWFLVGFVFTIHLIFTFLATLFVELVGRKTLLLISTTGLCLGQGWIVFRLYMGELWVIERGLDDWMSIVSFSLIVFSGAIGILAVNFVVITEITPPKLRSLMSRVHVVLMFILAVIIEKILRNIGGTIDISGAVIIFAAFSFLSTILIAIFVPETKGKSIEEIQKNL